MNKPSRFQSASRRALNWGASIRRLRASAPATRKFVSLSAAIAAFAAAALPASATNYYWDGGTTNITGNGDGVSQGGAGTWSTAIANWDVGSGVPHSAWVNGNTANFSGTGATVTLGTAITTDNIFISGTSGYTIANGGFQLTLTGGVTATTAFVNTISGTGTLALTGGGTHTFALTGAALNISSAITGSDAITLTGGNLGLSGANTGYTGKVTVTGGTLFLNSDLSLGAVPAAFVADSLTLNGGALTAGVPNGVANNYANANPIISANRGITLGTNGGTFNIGYATAGFATINSVISGVGSLTKTDTGTLFLNGANTYTGATILNGGAGSTVQIGTGGTSGSIANTSGITINTGNTLAVNRADAFTFAAPITGAGTLAQIGRGTTTLSLANSFSGATLVSGGTLNLDYNATGAAASGSILSSSGALTVTGGTFNVNGNATTASTQTLASLTVGGGAGTVSTSSPGAAATSLVFTSGTITRANANLNGATVAVGTVNFAPGAGSSINLGTAANAFLGTSAFYNNNSYAATDATGMVIAAAQTNAAVDGFTTATVNYGNTTSGATDTQTAAAATGNSAVFSGAAAKVIDIGATASNANTLTLNGFINTGGALTIQDSGAGATGGLTIGANKELIIGGNSNVTISAAIKNNAAGASGLTLSNTGTVTLSGTNTYTGPTTVNSGTVNMTGAGAQTSGALYVSLGGNNAVLNLNLASGGTLGLAAGNIIAGGTAASTGVINLSGGAITTTGQMDLGSFNGGYGVLNMSGGALNLAGIRNGGGNNGGANSFGNSYINLTGGTLTNTAITAIGRTGIGTNIFLLNGAGAVFNAGTSLAAVANFEIGYTGGGYSVATVGAGTLNAYGTIFLNSQNSAQGSTTILNLNGGIASSAGGIVSGTGGTTIANFNGGTLQAKGTATTISGLTSANVYSGGLTYDTNTFNNTVAQPLLGAGGTTGVSSIPLASNGTGYVAAPVVNISGGGGTGASAVAVFDPVTGTVTGITITSAGTGYTSAPTVTLIGGGGTTSATLGTIATATNAADGGLIKNGAGNLTLSGASTFSGNVTVNAGTLTVGIAGANNGSTGALGVGSGGRTVTVNAGATLALIQNTFGNGQTANTLPTLTLNGGTLTTTRYTPVGALNLNGATVTASASDAGNYQAFALRGNVTVGGSAPSTISSTNVTTTTGGYHLGANTTFTVAATGGAGADLTVSAPLINQSGDFGNAAGGLTKAGAGVMTLTATNTYTGTTTINAGTLLVNNTPANPLVLTSSGTGTGTVTVGNAAGTLTAVLGGTGSIVGATTINTGSTITGGTLGTVGALTLQSTLTLTGGTYAVDISGATADSLTISGALSLTNANITFTGTPTASSYVLATFASETGNFAGTAPSGYTFQFNGAGTELDLVAVPEPATWVAGCMLVGMIGVSQRRRVSDWLKFARG